MRYWRITSSEADLGLKEPYDPAMIRNRLEEHAAHFVSVLEGRSKGRSLGTVVALYDTELFGHWWFEGPEWLYHVIKKLAAGPVEPMTAQRRARGAAADDDHLPPRGLLGRGRLPLDLAQRRHGLDLEEDLPDRGGRGRAGPAPGRLDRRILKQFFREKFLLESSDWPFLISTWSARDYAENRAAEHFERALTLAGWLEAGRVLGPAEEALLAVFEAEDRLFEEVVLPDGTII